MDLTWYYSLSHITYLLATALLFNLNRCEAVESEWSPTSSSPRPGFVYCNRDLPGVTAKQSQGDNGFKIKISGTPEKYVPGELYTVILQGHRTDYTTQKFMAFMLVVEPRDWTEKAPHNEDVPPNVGTFQLFGDSLTKLSDDCPNAVVHTSTIFKSEIQVMWQAPPAGSGCVIFKATIVENKEYWYRDDGGLTKVLCEEETESLDEQPEVLEKCCACEEAKYEVIFEGLWSKNTHPKDFPSTAWLTHFSDIIGASHSADFRMWEYGGYASEGFRQVAEMGVTKKLESELKQESLKIRTIIKARGLWHPNLNGKTFAVFRVDRKHHLMSLVSMLGPSPDWVVGVSALELCLKNCSWVAEKQMNLYLWDAGTDSGISYLSANQPTIPQERIRRITSSNPSNSDSPFYDQMGAKMKPFAKLTVTRQRMYEKSCDEDGNEIERVPGHPVSPAEEEAAKICMMPKEVGPCRGYFPRWHYDVTRGMCVQFIFGGCRGNRNNFERHADCNKMCEVMLRGAVSTAIASKSPSKMMSLGSQIVNHSDQPIIDCVVTPWDKWSECTKTCGPNGRRTRRRFIKLHPQNGGEPCPKKLVQRRKCKNNPPCRTTRSL